MGLGSFLHFSSLGCRLLVSRVFVGGLRVAVGGSAVEERGGEVVESGDNLGLGGW